MVGDRRDLGRREERVELGGDDAVVVAGLDGQDPGDRHLALGDLLRGPALERDADGHEQDVREAHREQGGDEGDLDAGAQLLGLGEVGHDGDQAHDRAQDAEGGRVARPQAPQLVALAVAALERLDLEREDLLDVLGLDAVDDHLEAALEERVLELLDVALEGEGAGLAGPAARSPRAGSGSRPMLPL